MEAARPARATDLPELEALASAAIEELSPLRGGALWRAQSARPAPVGESLAADLEDPGVHVVVGTVDDTVVGYGVSRLEHLRDGSTLAVVTDLFVRSGARGVGVGERMMETLVSAAQDAGAIGIDSLALPGDRETKNFFETFGLKARAIVVHRSFASDGPGEPDGVSA